MERRLSTILAADVAGYSRLMEADEERTHGTFRVCQATISGVVTEHGGRIFGGSGDSIMVEFGSPVQAVRAALEIQNDLAEGPQDLPEGHRMQFRIGINLGDVIVDRDNLFGDSVNVAARLQALADPGGICTSESVHEHVENKLHLTFDDLGVHEVKNITKPVRVFRARLSASVVTTQDETLSLPPKPSVAVLPFTNMSGDPEQQYFSDGITEDIITELSRFRTLFVIARSSSFQFRDKAADVKRIARQLGVAYVVDGSVRKAGDRVRIGVQLIEAATRSHLWAEHYDRGLECVFAIQDEVTQSIVSKLAGRLEAAELKRTRRKPTEHLLAFECLHRAKALMNATGSGENEAVRRLLEKAIVLDPGCGRAYSLLAMTHIFDWQRSHSPDCLERAYNAARLALGADDEDSWSHFAPGFVCLQLRQFEQAQEHYNQAVNLNPNDADIVANMGEFLAYVGRPEEAIEWITRAMRLNPLHPESYWNDLAGAYYGSHRYQDAVAAFLQMPQPFWAQDVYLAACYGQLGDTAMAKRHVDEVLKRMSDFSARRFVTGEPYKHEADIAHLLDGLRKAGLPE